jgi:hypothetical protein
MLELKRYIELIVEPTFEEFSKNSQSTRLGYLACVAAYHAIDRAAFPKDARVLEKHWCEESQEFMLITEVAMFFKHGQRRWVNKRKAEEPDALLVTLPLGLEGDGEGLDTRHLYFLLRDTIKFLRLMMDRIAIARSVLARRASEAMNVPFLQVVLKVGPGENDRSPEMNKCHDNVRNWIAANPNDKEVLGYRLVEEPECWVVHAHSVVERENGSLFDITPLHIPQSYPFVRHIGSAEEFRAMMGHLGTAVSTDDG